MRLSAANGYPEGHQDKHPGSVEADTPNVKGGR